MASCYCLGIDLGTKNSCVAGVRTNVSGLCVERFENDYGLVTTPSVVNFDDYEICVGNAATDRLLIEPATTFYDVKRFIGKKYTDPNFKQIQNDFAYKIFKNPETNMPELHIQTSQILHNKSRKLISFTYYS